MTALMRLCILVIMVTAMLAIVIVGSFWAPASEDTPVQASVTPVVTETRTVRTTPRKPAPPPANASGHTDVVMGHPLPSTMQPPTPTPLPGRRHALTQQATATGTGSTTVQLDRWTVGKHETLSEIAQKALGSARRWREIALLNPDVDPDRLPLGKVLKLPTGGSTTAASSSPATADATTSSATASRGARTYVVRSGDNLSTIAKRVLGSAAKWRSIYELNKAALQHDPDNLHPGLTLVLPTP